MPKKPETTEDDQIAEWKLQAQLSGMFEDMPAELPLYLFTRPGVNEAYSAATRAVIRFIRQAVPRISLREFDLDHRLAKEWQVDVSPTLLVDPDRYKIRWLGAPVAEESGAFIEALRMTGYGAVQVSKESRKILDRLDAPRNLKVFVSLTCPYCPQQVINAVKAAVARPDIISVEVIDIQVNQDLAEEYSAQGVPLMFSDGALIAHGAQSEELFMLSVEKREEQIVFIPESEAEEVETDLVIVGGGPAGLTAGIYAERGGIRAAVIEKNVLGGQVATTPMIENYLGFSQVGGKTLVDIMVSHALEYTHIYPSEEVLDVTPGDPFRVLTTRRRFTARAVLLATGASYRKLNVPGEALLAGHGVSYCSTCDGPLFKGKRVVMVGGGDSAATEALHLSNIGVDVTLVHRRSALRAQRKLADAVSESGIPVLYNTEVKKIHGTNRVTGVTLYNNVSKKTKKKPLDGVFVAIGYEPAVGLARKIGIELTADGYIKHDERHRTNIAGVYSAGDVEGGYKQIVTAAGQGAEAALALFEDLMKPYWKAGAGS